VSAAFSQEASVLRQAVTIHRTNFPTYSEDGECNMTRLLRKLWVEEGGQDIAEYAVMLAVILVLVVGTVRLIGSNANTVFSNAASSIQ
jgi:Flp pilus assembly pilin Flp